VPDRRLDDLRHLARDERRVAQVEIVAGVDREARGDRRLRRRLEPLELGLELRLAPRGRVGLGVELDAIDAGRRW
jgi:hypothetical protein